jgi:hypothetical protein
MAQLTSIIPPRSFELIRDRIGAILLTEFAAQFALSSDPIWQQNPWMERNIPFSHAELPAVNVQFVQAPYDNQDASQVDGTFLFYIDCYVKSKHTDDGDADTLANLKLQKLMGGVQAILMDPRYMTLGFNKPFIMNRIVNDISVGDAGKQDGTNSVMGRVTLKVRAPEIPEREQARVMYGFDTRVYLHLSDKGYLWTSQFLGSGFDYILNHQLA